MCFFCTIVLSRYGYAEGTEDTSVPLTLEKCVSIALEKSPSLAISKSDLDAKEASLSAATKELYPSLNFQYGYTRLFRPLATPVIQEPENYYSYAVTASQPVYMGKSLVTGVAISELTLDASKSNFFTSRNNLIYSVHQGYFNLLKAEKLKSVAEQSLVNLQSHKKDAAAFYQAGLIPKNDLLHSEVELAQGEQNLLMAQNGASYAMAVLNNLLKRPVDAPIEVKDLLTIEPVAISWESVQEKALANRPEISAAELSLQKSEKNIALEKAAYLPSVTVSATYKKQGDDVFAGSYELGENTVTSAQAVASWDFWTWGKNRDKVSAAQQLKKQSSESVRQTRDRIILEARDAYLDLKQAGKNISVTEKAIVHAKENYRINEARYQAQLNTSTEVLDAQTLLSKARSNYYSALYDYRIASAALNRAIGIIDSQ